MKIKQIFSVYSPDLLGISKAYFLGNRIIFNNNFGRFFIYHLTTSKIEQLFERSHYNTHLAASPCQRFFVTSNTIGETTVYDAKTLRPSRILPQSNLLPKRIQISNDGKLLFKLNRTQDILSTELETINLDTGETTTKNLENVTATPVISGDAKRVAFFNNKCIFIKTLINGYTPKPYFLKNGASAISFSTCNETLYVGTGSGDILQLRASTCKKINSPPMAHTQSYIRFIHPIDDTHVVCVYKDSAVIWNILSCEKVHTFNNVLKFSYSPRDGRFCTVSSQTSIQNITTYQILDKAQKTPKVSSASVFDL